MEFVNAKRRGLSKTLVQPSLTRKTTLHEVGTNTMIPLNDGHDLNYNDDEDEYLDFAADEGVLAAASQETIEGVLAHQHLYGPLYKPLVSSISGTVSVHDFNSREEPLEVLAEAQNGFSQAS